MSTVPIWTPALPVITHPNKYAGDMAPWRWVHLQCRFYFSAKVGFNDAVINAVWDKPRKCIKNWHDDNVSFNSIISMTIQLGNLFRDRRPKTFLSLTPPSSQLAPEPMQPMDTHQSTSEKELCRNKVLCFYSANAGHNTVQCPERPNQPIPAIRKGAPDICSRLPKQWVPTYMFLWLDSRS